MTGRIEKNILRSDTYGKAGETDGGCYGDHIARHCEGLWAVDQYGLGGFEQSCSKLGFWTSEETRQRVHAAAKKLGYMPVAAARALRGGKANFDAGVLPNKTPVSFVPIRKHLFLGQVRGET